VLLFEVGSNVGSLGVQPGDHIVRQTSVAVTFNGMAIPLETLIAVRCSYGWDQPVSTADITLSTYPIAGGTYHDPVEVTVNGVLRFVGILADKDYSNSPRTVVLKARGDLCRAEEYENQNPDLDPFMPEPGIDLSTLLGGPSSGTLKEITLAVLTVCGVDTSNAAAWADPPHVYGLEADEEFMWKFGTTGLSYLHSLFEASAGHRLFHSGDGLLWLAQIIGRPRSGAADLTIAEGVDILDGGNMTRSISKHASTVVVSGLDDGDGFGPLYAVATDGPSPFPPDKTFRVSSSMIETEAFASELANDFWILEVDRELVTGSVSTWRDDVMGPGQSHLVLSGPEQPTSVYGDAGPGGRLGTGEKLWVIGLTLDLNEKGEFTQTMSYLGGGLEADYVPVPV